MEFLILTLINLGSIALIFLYFRVRFQQSLNAQNLLRGIKEEIDELVKELNQSAERNIAILEERALALEKLLAQTDSKILLLTREVERKESQGTYSPLKPNILPQRADRPMAQAHQDSKPKEPRALKEQVLVLRDQNFDAWDISRQTGIALAEVELILSLNPKPYRA